MKIDFKSTSRQAREIRVALAGGGPLLTKPEQESIIAAKLEEYHRTMKVRLECVEHALDTSSKWSSKDDNPPMTQAVTLLLVRCILADLSEEK